MNAFQRLIVIAALIVTFAGTEAFSFAAPRPTRSTSVRPVPVQPVRVQPEVLPTPPEVTPVPPPVIGRPVMPPNYLAPNYLALVAPPKYRVRVKHHRTLRKTCCGSCVARTVILDVQGPNHRAVAFPVPIPGCCAGDPVVAKDRDILGRFSYTYRWPSDYKIDVVFRVRGDIVVHTWGR